MKTHSPFAKFRRYRDRIATAPAPRSAPERAVLLSPMEPAAPPSMIERLLAAVLPAPAPRRDPVSWELAQAKHEAERELRRQGLSRKQATARVAQLLRGEL